MHLNLCWLDISGTRVCHAEKL